MSKKSAKSSVKSNKNSKPTAKNSAAKTTGKKNTKVSSAKRVNIPVKKAVKSVQKTKAKSIVKAPVKKTTAKIVIKSKIKPVAKKNVSSAKAKTTLKEQKVKKVATAKTPPSKKPFVEKNQITDPKKASIKKDIIVPVSKVNQEKTENTKAKPVVVEVGAPVPVSNSKPLVVPPAKKTATEAVATTRIIKSGSKMDEVLKPLPSPYVHIDKSQKEPVGKFELEYVVHASAQILYDFLTSPSGLSEWFCDDVNIRNGVYSFIWDGSQQQAKLIKIVEDKMVRFQWMDKCDGSYFEFRIEKDDLTSDISLIVVDFAETPDDAKSSKLLWDSQVHKLLQVLGSYF